MVHRVTVPAAAVRFMELGFRYPMPACVFDASAPCTCDASGTNAIAGESKGRGVS